MPSLSCLYSSTVSTPSGSTVFTSPRSSLYVSTPQSLHLHAPVFTSSDSTVFIPAQSLHLQTPVFKFSESTVFILAQSLHLHTAPVFTSSHSSSLYSSTVFTAPLSLHLTYLQSPHHQSLHLAIFFLSLHQHSHYTCLSTHLLSFQFCFSPVTTPCFSLSLFAFTFFFLLWEPRG
jgi:hypothetical protein